MTTAPPSLLAVRAIVRTCTGLSAVATGIVGDANHRGGYHQGKDKVDSDDYSVRESPRDRAGLSEYSCAFDEGKWSLRVKGKTHDLRSHSLWMVAQCKANTPDSRDIREIIYSPDGKVVKRWDRLGIRSTGDSSHLEHTHRSYFRDAVKSGRDLTAFDRRYFTEIGLLAGEDDDMDLDDKIDPDGTLSGYNQRTLKLAVNDQVNERAVWWGKQSEIPKDHRPDPDAPIMQVIGLPAKLDALAAKVDQLAATPPGSVVIDKADLVEAVREVLREGVGTNPVS